MCSKENERAEKIRKEIHNYFHEHQFIEGILMTKELMSRIEPILEPEWTRMINDETLPVPPCLAYWDDGKCTVLNDQNDCQYAVYNMNPTLTHWQPLPQPSEDE